MTLIAEHNKFLKKREKNVIFVTAVISGQTVFPHEYFVSKFASAKCTETMKEFLSISLYNKLLSFHLFLRGEAEA
jgi:hypothetical protein